MLLDAMSQLPQWDPATAAAFELFLAFVLFVLGLNEWIGNGNDKKKPPRTGRR